MAAISKQNISTIFFISEFKSIEPWAYRGLPLKSPEELSGNNNSTEIFVNMNKKVFKRF